MLNGAKIKRVRPNTYVEYLRGTENITWQGKISKFYQKSRYLGSAVRHRALPPDNEPPAITSAFIS